MLTKEECRESLSDLYNVLCSRLNEEMQDYRQDFDRLGELIREHFDKETPLKVDTGMFASILCHKCGSKVNKLDNYCYNCGQKLDWSDFKC